MKHNLFLPCYLLLPLLSSLLLLLLLLLACSCQLSAVRRLLCVGFGAMVLCDCALFAGLLWFASADCRMLLLLCVGVGCSLLLFAADLWW